MDREKILDVLVKYAEKLTDENLHKVLSYVEWLFVGQPKSSVKANKN